jgi:hypothetical protein
MDPLLALQLAEIDSRIETLETTIEESERELSVLTDGDCAGAAERDPVAAARARISERPAAVRECPQRAGPGLDRRTARGGRTWSADHPARTPGGADRPASPNRRLIAVVSLAVGLGLALAYFFLMELVNRSVRRPTELVKALNVTPFATLPRIETRRDRFLRLSYTFAKIGIAGGGRAGGPLGGERILHATRSIVRDGLDPTRPRVMQE